MKILLVSANTMKEPYPTYPIGLDYVLHAISPPHQVQLADINELPNEAALGDLLRRYLPDVVGISIRNIDNVDERRVQTFIGEIGRLIAIIRRHSTGTVVLGGSGFSILPGEIMEALDADFGVVGEGERFPALLEALERGADVSHLSGIVARGEPVVLPEPLTGPFPRGAFPHHSHTSYYLKRGGMLNLQTKRGCPFSCIYCVYPHIEGRKFRTVSPGEVARTARMLQDGGAKYLYITDSTFNGAYEHSREVALAFRREGVSVPWGGFFTPTAAPPDYYKILADAGLRHVEFGTESLSNPVLRRYRKPFVLADVRASHRLAQAAGLHVAHYLLLGGPGEDEETLKETLTQADRLGNTVFFAYCGIRIYPYTALCEMAVEEGRIEPGTNLLHPIFYWSPGLSREKGMALVEDHGARRANWIIGAGPPGMFKLMAKMYARGHVGPLWEHLIR